MPLIKFFNHYCIPFLKISLLCFVLEEALLAGHITLQISTTPTPGDQEILCTVSIVNQGDESAANVQAHVEFQGKRYSAQVLPTLVVGQTYQGTYRIPSVGLAPGRYNLVIIVDYTDTNGYPFTALSVASFPLREDFSPQIHGKVEPTELGGTSTLELRLKNQLTQKQSLQLKLILPKEISSDQTETQMELSSLQEKDVEFGLRNFSALEGSTYQVFILVEYLSEGKHASVAFPGSVKIIAARSFFQKYKLIILIVTAILAVLFAVIQIYSFMRHRHQK